MKTISCVINADSRRGFLTEDESYIGKYAPGGQEGARSVDFLLEGVKNKMDFFRGYDCQCILYIDEHEPIPDGLFVKICDQVQSYGNNSRVMCKPHNRTRHRWYDYIYIEALKLAEGDYVVHFDTDTFAFRTDDCDIVDAYIDLLDSSYKYVCYPTEKQPNDDYWASTRFFITKRETLNAGDLENCINNSYLNEKYGRIRFDPYPCCLEHTIGLMVKEGEVLYPPREDDKYIIACWATYYKGTLKRLMQLPYSEVQKEICQDIHGANDYVDKNLNA